MGSPGTAGYNTMMAASAQFKIRFLGPLEFFDGTRWAPIRAAKQRALLAILLVNANRTVPVYQLIAPPSGIANRSCSSFTFAVRLWLSPPGQVLTWGRRQESASHFGRLGGEDVSPCTDGRGARSGAALRMLSIARAADGVITGGSSGGDEREMPWARYRAVVTSVDVLTRFGRVVVGSCGVAIGSSIHAYP
ncbi:hypothetical protein ABT369_50015 [Dactylosporangium sp. NPDC000244]|uniref:AfsR/SARP family transcriptional regulator n=1 Tax=Dactylosporangium sp. NPDC000244 TaxID=3154365 RepID=UPI003329C2DD